MIFVEAKTSRLLVACTLGIGLVLLLLGPLEVWGQEGAGTPVNLDIILLIDNSWSMSREDPVTGAPPSDPEQLRIRAARFVVDYLRANAETVRANYRVGVVSFGGVVSDVVPLRLVQDETVREGIHFEQIKLTDFRGPLELVRRELEAKSFGTGNRMAVVLFTDGRPHLTAAPMTEEKLRAYFKDLDSLVGNLQEEGASVFVVGIQDEPEDRDNWIQIIPQDRYFSVTSVEQLVDVSRHILADLTGAAVPEASTIPAGQAVFVDVEHYLERVLFSFMKSDPAIHITLISPSGAILAPTTRGTAEVHHAIYSIRDPDPGEWKAFWEGEGEVRYWVERQYPLIRVESARSSSPVGQPITITASLVRNNEPVVDPDLHIEAEITLPDGDVVTQALSPIGGGRYTGSYEDVRVKGVYTVTGRAFLDDQQLLAHPLSVTVDVFALPTVVTPTPQATLTSTAIPGPTPSPSPTLTPMPPTATPSPSPWSIALELGDIQFSPSPPRHGQPLSIAIPIMVTGPMTITGVTVTMHEKGEPVALSHLLPGEGRFSGAFEEMRCQWRGNNVYPCARRRITAILCGALPADREAVFRFHTTLSVRWSTFVERIIALVMVMLATAIGYGAWRLFPRLYREIVMWKLTRPIRALPREAKRARRGRGSTPEDVLHRLMSSLKEADQALDKLADRMEKDKFSEVMRLQRGRDPLLIAALYDAREGLPGEAVKRIADVAQGGWSEMLYAAAALAWLLKETRQNNPDMEPIILAELSKRLPDPGPLLEIASRGL